MASVPLTFHDVYGDENPAEIADDIYGDGTELLIGHLTAAQAQARLARQPWWQTHYAVDPDTIEHAWVTWDEHAPGCDRPDGTIPGRPGDGCDCSWAPWILYHWREAHPTDPDAVAVTFVQLADPDLTVGFACGDDFARAGGGAR